MLKKVLILTLAGLLINTAGIRPALAGAQEEKPARRVEKVRQDVERLGVGEKARVEVRLAGRKTLKGYVREAGANDFVVVDRRTGAANTVEYREVEKIRGRNLSTGAKIAIGFGIAAAVLATLALIGLHYAD